MTLSWDPCVMAGGKPFMPPIPPPGIGGGIGVGARCGMGGGIWLRVGWGGGGTDRPGDVSGRCICWGGGGCCMYGRAGGGASPPPVGGLAGGGGMRWDVGIGGAVDCRMPAFIWGGA